MKLTGSTFSLAVAGCVARTVPAVVVGQQVTTIHFPKGGDNRSIESRRKMGAFIVTEGKADFNNLSPNSYTSIFTGFMAANGAVDAAVSVDGNYKIRVYQMGDDKDASKTESDRISTTIMN